MFVFTIDTLPKHLACVS